jgi:hypothetical protein
MKLNTQLNASEFNKYFPTVAVNVSFTDGNNSNSLLFLHKASPSQFPSTNLVQTTAGEIHKIMQSHKSKIKYLSK